MTIALMIVAAVLIIIGLTGMVIGALNYDLASSVLVMLGFAGLAFLGVALALSVFRT